MNRAKAEYHIRKAERAFGRLNAGSRAALLLSQAPYLSTERAQAFVREIESAERGESRQESERERLKRAERLIRQAERGRGDTCSWR